MYVAFKCEASIKHHMKRYCQNNKYCFTAVVRCSCTCDSNFKKIYSLLFWS